MSGDFLESGYVVFIEYLSHYNVNQTPIRLSYVASLFGYTPPNIHDEFSYLDIGCGTGVTLNILADCYPHAKFVGIDFNPKNIDVARATAEKAGLTNVEFHCVDFQEFLRQPVQKYQFISCMGVYVWVDEENRDHVDRIVDQCLDENGIFVVSYYALPGAAQRLALYDIVKSFAEMETGDADAQINKALNKLVALRNDGYPFFEENQIASDYLDVYRRRDKRSRVHSLGTKHFNPRYFRDVASNFLKMGLSHVGDATLCGNARKWRLHKKYTSSDEFKVYARHQACIGMLENDYFRNDVYVRATPSVSLAKVGDILKRYKLDTYIYPMSFPGQIGDGPRRVSTSDPVVSKVIGQFMLGNGGAIDLEQLRQSTNVSEIEMVDAVQNLLSTKEFTLMMGSPEPVDISPDDIIIVPSKLNQLILDRFPLSENIAPLSSSVSGAGMCFTPFTAFMLKQFVGKTVAQGLADMVQALKSLSPEELSHLKVTEEQINSGDYMSETLQEIVNRYLPVLIKYKVFALTRDKAACVSEY